MRATPSPYNLARLVRYSLREGSLIMLNKCNKFRGSQKKCCYQSSQICNRMENPEAEHHHTASLISSDRIKRFQLRNCIPRMRACFWAPKPNFQVFPRLTDLKLLGIRDIGYKSSIKGKISAFLLCDFMSVYRIQHHSGAIPASVCISMHQYASVD